MESPKVWSKRQQLYKYQNCISLRHTNRCSTFDDFQLIITHQFPMIADLFPIYVTVFGVCHPLIASDISTSIQFSMLVTPPKHPARVLGWLLGHVLLFWGLGRNAGIFFNSAGIFSIQLVKDRPVFFSLRLMSADRSTQNIKDDLSLRCFFCQK